MEATKSLPAVHWPMQLWLSVKRLGYGSGPGSPFDPYPDPYRVWITASVPIHTPRSIPLIYEQAQGELAKVHKCSSDSDRPFTLPCWVQLCRWRTHTHTHPHIYIYIYIHISFWAPLKIWLKLLQESSIQSSVGKLLFTSFTFESFLKAFGPH